MSTSPEGLTTLDYSKPDEWKSAKTEFVCFVKPGTGAPLVHEALLQVYKDNPQFRKLSIVAPVIQTSHMMVYGWWIQENVMGPKLSPSSLEPYAVQVASITDSVIRRSALEKLDFQFTGSQATDSTNFCLALWESGQRCYIVPSVILADKTSPYMSVQFDNQYKGHEEVQKLFRREMIG